MRITRIDARLLSLPASRPISLPLADAAAGAAAEINVLLAQVETDAGATGIGFGCIADGGRPPRAAIEDDLTPLLLGESALHYERLWAKALSLYNPAAHRAYAVLDIALWDLK